MCGSRHTEGAPILAYLLLCSRICSAWPAASHSVLAPNFSSMACAIMATAVAGLGSSMLRHSHAITKGLQGPLKVRKASRLGFAPIRAAKLPPGVEPPRDEPKLPVPFWGFTENAEVWNSRASLIGIVGILIVEAIINKGLLQTIGIDVGKGLDLPL